MKNHIKKSVPFTHFKLASHTVENGELKIIEMGEDKVIGLIPEKKLLKQMRDIHQNETIVVYNVWEETVEFKLDLETFVQVASPIKPEQKEETQ